MAWSTEILADAPVAYWQHRIVGGIIEADASGNGNTLEYAISGGTYQQPSLVGEASDYAVAFDGSAGHGWRLTPAAITSAGAVTLEWVGRVTDAATTNRCLIIFAPNGGAIGGSYDGAGIYLGTSGELIGYCCQTGGLARSVITALDIRDSAPRHIVLTADGSTVRLYVDGVEVGNNTMTGLQVAGTPGTDRTMVGAYMLNWSLSLTAGHLPGEVCESAIYAAALSPTRIAAHYAEANFPSSASPAASLPLTLSGFIPVAAASLPLRLLGLTASAAATLPLRLESADPAHYLATAARWGLVVSIDGVDLSARLAGPVDIEREEDASALCTLTLSPVSGSIDPAAYERKHLIVRVVGHDAAGAVLYQSTRYTGTTTAADYDPDRGLMTVEATTDLQGRLEQLERPVIDALLGGRWSEHVFEATADGYQYAMDQLSTIESELHVDALGRLVVVPWAAKGTPDITLTDAGRFPESLRLVRAQRRDLLTAVVINLDFRFVRLRHRAITVQFIDELGFCHYLNNGWKLASKNMITQAADGSDWTRTSPITFVDLPGPGTYCTPTRGWAGNAQAFALGANWTAARRWAQTITEQYRITVSAPDLAETIGAQAINADYGLEAIYDASDYEAQRAFDGPPAGAVLAPETEDYQLDADAVEHYGRTALEAAAECAIAWARGQLLGRARSNRLTVETLWRPDITLESTVRVQTAHLDATGKVAALAESLDPVTGALRLRLRLALSRHDGSGLAADDPVAAPSQPAQPAETPTDRIYTVGYHLGGLSASPPDSEDFDGLCTNVAEAVQDPGAELYRERFALRMPAIEAVAREAAVAAGDEVVICAIPEDPLTMSN